MRTILLACLMAMTVVASAAHLRVFGTVTDLETRSPISNVIVKIYKDGQRITPTFTSNNGKYNVDLDNGAFYVLRFVMQGRVTKCFSIDTHGGEWEGNGKTVSLEVGIELFGPIAGMDFSFFDMPLGMAQFRPLNGQILWCKEYEARVAPLTQNIMTERASRIAHYNAAAQDRVEAVPFRR